MPIPDATRHTPASMDTPTIDERANHCFGCGPANPQGLHLTFTTDTLTPEQQTLDQRLREWRKAESERLNLPLFFVLASTTLRSIVLTRPQTLSQLKDIHGLGHEKIEKFGPGILEICTT